jgi:hypothetical protein
MASTCAWAWATVAPGFSLPMLAQLLLCRALSDSCSGVNARRQIRTFGSTNRNASGMTPTIVKACRRTQLAADDARGLRRSVPARTRG